MTYKINQGSKQVSYKIIWFRSCRIHFLRLRTLLGGGRIYPRKTVHFLGIIYGNPFKRTWELDIVIELSQNEALKQNGITDISSWPARFLIPLRGYLPTWAHPGSDISVDCSLYVANVSVLRIINNSLEALHPEQIHLFRLTAAYIIWIKQFEFP